MIKLIASDMDGTLLNGAHVITEETIAEIRRVQEAGILFVITTGRMYEDARKDLEQYGIQCAYLAMNGALLVNSDGEIVQRLDITPQDVSFVTQYLTQHRLYAELYTTEGIFTPSDETSMFDAVVAKYQTFFPSVSREELRKTWKDAPQQQSIKHIEQVEQLAQRDICVSKILSFSEQEEKMEQARRELGEHGSIAVSASFPCNLEVTTEQAQKGKALERFAKHIGIAREEIMVIGDSYNDLSMLREDFGATVAMGNALEEIKRVAKFVTRDNNHEGAAFAMQCARENRLERLKVVQQAGMYIQEKL